jgi:hypothetical protein
VPDDGRMSQNVLADYVKTSVFFNIEVVFVFIDHCGELLQLTVKRT